MTKGMTKSLFDSLEEAAPDPILSTQTAFIADTSKEKVNLGIGAYRTHEGKPYVFRCVRQVEREMAFNDTLYKEYLPIDGLPELKEGAQKLIFGGNCSSISEKRICSAQVLSGTGALRAAAEFLRIFFPKFKVVYLSRPTWENHTKIFQMAGFTVKEYPYWNAANRSIDMKGYLSALESAPEGSVVVLHGCAHNPTGLDPTEAEWKQILEVVQRKGLMPILDVAYQGFATGNMDTDAWAIRLFEASGLELFVCQSFAKNLGLYGERLGMLHIVCATAERAQIVLGNLKLILRPMHSSPPLHGARILAEILSSPKLKSMWEEELVEITTRIKDMREKIRHGLEAKGTPGSWDHITQQIGMFSYTGLTPAQCERMISKWHVYLMKTGRISMAGLNNSNIHYVVDCIDDCVNECKD